MSFQPSTVGTEYAHIVRTPGVFGGEPCIAEHRIRVRDIVAARDRGGLTAEEIASSVYPGLSKAQIYAALAYYEDHREEIDRAAAEEDQVAAKFRRQHPELTRDHRDAEPC